MDRSVLAGALAALLGIVFAVPALAAPVPLPVNGDFALGSANWVVEGHAGVVGDHGEVGQAGCVGDEGALVLGRLTTLAPLPLRAGQRLAYDYRITTAEPSRLDGLRVVIVDPTLESPRNVDLLNPNEGRTDCNTYVGQRLVVVPRAFAYARLEFHVWGDGAGDLFHAEIDNVRLDV